MLSTINKDLKIIDGKMHIVPKEYPNWYGIEDIGFIWHGEWADPEIEYDGMVVNSFDIENTMWERWLYEENGDENDDIGFSNYMLENKSDIYQILEEMSQ